MSLLYIRGVVSFKMDSSIFRETQVYQVSGFLFVFFPSISDRANTSLVRQNGGKALL